MRIEASNIAVVKLGAIGDVVNSLPFVNRLRAGYPEARITWVIAPFAHGLVEGHPAVDEFLVCDVKRARGWPACLRRLRERRVDLALDLQRILKSGLIARATGARHRLGFDRARCKEQSWVFTNAHIPPNPNPGVTLAQYLEFADFLELPATPVRWDLPFVPFDPPSRGELRIVVNVGASKPANRWDPAQWSALCTRLVRDLGARLHLIGGIEDRPAVETVLAACRAESSHLVDHAGRLAWKETAGLIRSAALFVGGDTGPLHIAVAVGTRTVSLYGASDPRRTGPFREERGIVSQPAPCSPCRRRVCNVAGHPCMSLLSIDLVFERIRSRLGEPSS